MIGEVRCRQSVALAVLALVAGADPAPAQMGGTDGRIVTVAVPLPAASGSYRVEVKPGVRLVGPAAGQATDSVLPLSFVLPATAASGLQTLADVVVGGRRLAVTTRVAVRHALALRAAAPGVVRAEAGDTIWLVVENRGNVPETVALRSGTPPRGFRIELGRSAAHLPVGGRTEVPVVMREVGTGEASLRVSASAGPASAHAQLRIAAAARRPRGVPVSVTVLAPHDRGQQPVVVATGQAWLGDSVLVRASYGTRDVFWSWFPGLLGSRQRILELRAPRWSLSAGDITLPGSTGMVPWLSGFGARASLGQRLGWSGHAALVRETHASASSAAVTAAWRAARLGVHATVVARTAEDRPLSRLWVLGGDWANGGARWIGELGSANVGAGEVAVGAFDLTYAGARGMVRGSAVRQAEMAGPIGLVKMRADGGAEVRVLDGLTYFGRAAASRSSWPGGDEGEQGWAVSTEALGGARARVGRALVTTSMRRTCFASSRPPSVSYAAMEAAVSSVVSIGPRMSIRPEAALRRSDATGRWRPRAGAAFAWSANDAFLSLAGEWGQPRSGYAAPDEAPGWNASAQMWARHGTGSGDLVVTLTRTQDGRVVGHGTASLAWRVLPRAELLAAIRNLPRVPAAPGGGWSVSLGLRTDFSLAWNAPSPSGLVFEDLNRNGQRDRGDHPIAGVPLQWGLVERVSDAHGRFKLPDERVGESAWPESDSGWQVIAAEGNRVAVARAGGVIAVVRFAVVASEALESIPAGAVVLRGTDGTEYLAEVDSVGQASWTGLPAGTYTAWHEPPAGRSGGAPAHESVTVEGGVTAALTLVASYAPRRVQLRVFGGADTSTGQDCSSRRVLVPGLTFDAVRCLFPGEQPLQASRGSWVRWTYVGRSRTGPRYGDFLFFRDGALVIALVRRLDERYHGPASLGPFIDG